MSLNLEVQILGEFKNLTKATKGATKQLTGLRNSARTIARQINSAFALIGVGLSFRALSSGIRGAINEASTLEESINAVRVSFGPASEAILAIGQNSAKSFGLARSEFNSAAVTFSAFVDELVGPGQDASDVIETLITRGADFASVYNIDVAEALRVFRSGLSGESEPLKRFGIILNDTAVKQFAYNKQIAQTGTELTNQQKVIARYQLLLEKTAKTEGDFANTSDSLANSLRVARASFTEVSASVGQGFAPAIAAVAQFISNNIGTFTALAEVIGKRVKEAFDNAGDSAINFGAKVTAGIDALRQVLSGEEIAPDNPFKGFIDGLSDLKIFADGVVNLFKGILTVVDAFINGLLGFLTIFGVNVDGLGGVIRFLGETLSNIGNFFQRFGEVIGFALSFLVPFTGTLKGVNLVFQGFGTVIGKVIKPVGDFVKSIGNIGKTGLPGIVANATNSFTKLTTTITKVFPGFDRVVKFFKDLPNIIKASPFGKFINDFIIQPIIRFVNAFDKGIGQIRSLLGLGSFGRDEPAPTTTPTNRGPADSGEKARFNRLRKQLELDTLTTTPPPGGTGDTPFQTRLKAIVATLQTALEDAKERIKNASESFRDSVGLSFGLITNGFRAKFSISRVIAQMKRIKDAAKTFAADIAELRKKGADASLIDELIGLGPLGGATTARALLQSGDLGEFLQLRRDLATQGAGVGGAANFGIYGTSVSGLESAISALNKTIAAGKGNTYNINVANPNVSPQQIIAAIKDYERKTKKKVLR